MTAGRPILVLAGRHRPHEQLLFAWGALSGAGFLLGVAPQPNSIVAAMPGAVVTLWSVGLVVSGVAGLVGCWWRSERGQLLEVGGLLIAAGSLLLYASAAVTVAGTRAIFPVGIVLAWFAANLWRAAEIQRDLRAGRRNE